MPTAGMRSPLVVLSELVGAVKVMPGQGCLRLFRAAPHFVNYLTEGDKPCQKQVSASSFPPTERKSI